MITDVCALVVLDFGRVGRMCRRRLLMSPCISEGLTIFSDVCICVRFTVDIIVPMWQTAVWPYLHSCYGFFNVFHSSCSQYRHAVTTEAQQNSQVEVLLGRRCRGSRPVLLLGSEAWVARLSFQIVKATSSMTVETATVAVNSNSKQ